MSSLKNSRHEQDSIHILPLKDLPLKTRSLKTARLVKNSRLQGVVELFSDGGSGSGQLDPEALAETFDFSGERQSDLEMVRSLCKLPSYDVYSLRLGFRDLGISPENNDCLRLSEDKSRELMEHMNVFTRPLISKIYGKEQEKHNSLKEIVRLFTDPDMQQARRNLMSLSESLGIGLSDIPVFLERYADVYLSLAYYTSTIELVSPPLRSLSETIEKIRCDSRYAQNGRLLRRIDAMGARFTEAEVSISSVLALFRSRTETMWEKIDGPSFRGMEKLIMSYQRGIGANLCALVVKMDAWDKLSGKGSLENCLQFLMSEISVGVELMPDLDLTNARAPLPEVTEDSDEEMEWVA
ncbi:MAG: hypothetical protein R3245_11925 [Kiloniellales bacterium]|nr:hypothetical protein [Kiloniellales bacterium]